MNSVYLPTLESSAIESFLYILETFSKFPGSLVMLLDCHKLFCYRRISCILLLKYTQLIRFIGTFSYPTLKFYILHNSLNQNQSLNALFQMNHIKAEFFSFYLYFDSKKTISLCIFLS